ncbi:UDP-glycosyltransferase 88B1-like [Salvia divinorum]|uniref:Glycosyltransferase n=1 Tax=Salvia divinorum TaxID=28513 RepID=A0ABD1FKB4_SALDI
METIVLYPTFGMGHLISMVELGKFILRRQPSLSITVLTMPPPFGSGSTADYISHISATVPSITFHHLPAVSLDQLDAFPSIEAILFEALDRHNPHVLRALETVSASAAVSAFVIDFFCTAALPIAAKLGIRTYYFLTSGAHFTSLLLHLPKLDRTTTQSFKDMKSTLLDVPGVPPVPASDMVRPLLDRTTSDYQNFLNVSNNMLDSAGILINTFESLEPTPLAAIREGKCNHAGRAPPIFCVGPLLAAQDRDAGEHLCLKWLDKQPSKSVVYICFGSAGLVSAAQLKEMAEGLERSGHRFLWVVRSPPWEDKAKMFLPLPEPDLEALLSVGFLERTEERGLVVKGWAPQVAVLGHAAVGGFVTHCGWNSILEAVCAGVPMATWPLYAEQHFNRVVVVEGLGVAVGVEEREDGLVAAEEVERRVREVMEDVSVRKLVEEKSAEAKAAMAEGGSSVAAMEMLLDLWTSD